MVYMRNAINVQFYTDSFLLFKYVIVFLKESLSPIHVTEFFVYSMFFFTTVSILVYISLLLLMLLIRIKSLKK